MKERGVLKKLPSEMTAEEYARWDALEDIRAKRIAAAVGDYSAQLQAIRDAHEQAMFDAGLWEFPDASDSESVEPINP